MGSLLIGLRPPWLLLAISFFFLKTIQIKSQPNQATDPMSHPVCSPLSLSLSLFASPCFRPGDAARARTRARGAVQVGLMAEDDFDRLVSLQVIYLFSIQTTLPRDETLGWIVHYRMRGKS